MAEWPILTRYEVLNMLFQYIELFCRGVIELTFIVSFFSKASNIANFTQTIDAFRILPERLGHYTALLFLSGECIVALLMFIGGVFLAPGFLLAILLLLIFCIALMLIVKRKIRISCNCFGSSEVQISLIDIWRNLGFMLCALGGWGTLLVLRSPREPLNIAEWGTITLSAALFVLIWTQLSMIVQVFRLDERN